MRMPLEFQVIRYTGKRTLIAIIEAIKSVNDFWLIWEVARAAKILGAVSGVH